LKIFLVRHGDADAELPEGLGDEARALTAKSRQVLATHFAALVENMRGIDLVLTSPLVRAVQTAQILSLVLKHEGLLHAHRSLVPEMPVGAIESVLRQEERKNVVLVGHEPSMGAMAAHLLAIPSWTKRVHPGTVIGIERSQDEGAAARLLFYAAPGQALLESL
jgi:phosphohistidine phosphatase